MGDENTRWTVVVRKQTDRNLRTRLAERGLKKGDLSKFIESAVNRQLFAQSWSEYSSCFDPMPNDERLALADEAVRWARQG